MSEIVLYSRDGTIVFTSVSGMYLFTCNDQRLFWNKCSCPSPGTTRTGSRCVLNRPQGKVRREDTSGRTSGQHQLKDTFLLWTFSRTSEWTKVTETEVSSEGTTRSLRDDVAVSTHTVVAPDSGTRVLCQVDAHEVAEGSSARLDDTMSETKTEQPRPFSPLLLRRCKTFGLLTHVVPSCLLYLWPPVRSGLNKYEV